MSGQMKQQRQAGFLMAKIRQVGSRIFEKMLKDSDVEINSAQGRIMFALWKKDGIAINELAKKTQLKKSTLTSMLDRLESMGYVKRKHDDKDRRKILIYRTDKDKALEKKYVEVSEEISHLYYDNFTQSQIERFEKDLEKILDNLTRFENK
jgi:DNA-binding MarR family transcriptional regulator